MKLALRLKLRRNPKYYHLTKLEEEFLKSSGLLVPEEIIIKYLQAAKIKETPLE